MSESPLSKEPPDVEEGQNTTNSQDSPLGWFHAVKTRDAVAQTRDGWPYYEAHPKGADQAGVSILEIRFGDGTWMLAAEDDVLKRDL